MPYSIKKVGSKYAIIKKSTGKVVAYASSRKNAGIYVWKAEGDDKSKMNWSKESKKLAKRTKKKVY